MFIFQQDIIFKHAFILPTFRDESIANDNYSAALLTNYLAKNGTTKPSLAERATSVYWMENMNQNGLAPYVSNSSYKVTILA